MVFSRLLFHKIFQERAPGPPFLIEDILYSQIGTPLEPHLRIMHQGTHKSSYTPVITPSLLLFTVSHAFGSNVETGIGQSYYTNK